MLQKPGKSLALKITIPVTGTGGGTAIYGLHRYVPL